MDDQKEEIENLRKQVKSLKNSLMLTQISTIVFTIIFGCQWVDSIETDRKSFKLKQNITDTVEI